MQGGVAQMVERSLSMREVPGSIPGISKPFYQFKMKIFSKSSIFVAIFLFSFWCHVKNTNVPATWPLLISSVDRTWDPMKKSFNWKSFNDNFISWRIQRGVIIEANFIVSSDYSTDFQAVYPIIYHMICQNSCSIYGKRNETPWISPDPYLSIETLAYDLLCPRTEWILSSPHVLKIYYGISKLIFELSVRRTLNTVLG